MLRGRALRDAARRADQRGEVRRRRDRGLPGGGAGEFGLWRRYRQRIHAALVVVFATWIVRFLTAAARRYYRRIHTLSESIDVLQWAGVVAIWVVNAGVWLSLAVVLGVEN